LGELLSQGIGCRRTAAWCGLLAPASLAPRWWRSRTLELGVPADERERILQRFTLPDGGTTRRGGRVGLYIARQLATSEGGELTTTKTAAARFELRLPLLAQAAGS
jgi:hypothetical protein